jgi:hypothetical protein
VTTVDQSMNRPGGDRSEPDATMTMLSGLLDGSLSGLATYHLLRAELLIIRGLPETPSRPTSNRG